MQVRQQMSCLDATTIGRVQTMTSNQRIGGGNDGS